MRQLQKVTPNEQEKKWHFAESDNRARTILGKNVRATDEELENFCADLKLPEKAFALMRELPGGQYLVLNNRHLQDVLDHPEQYKTLGLWLRSLRESSNLTIPKAAKILGVFPQALSEVELKRSDQKFQKIHDKLIIPEKFLDKNPYGVFPVDADGKVTEEFREKFLKLAEPNAMKAQYDAAQQWVHEDVVRAELGLDTSKKPHQAIIRDWRPQTKIIESGNEGSIFTAAGSTIAVMRDRDGGIHFHRSGLETLRKEMGIDSRQK